jgi:polyphosphate kinase
LTDAPGPGLNIAVALRDRGASRLAIVRVPDQMSSLVALTPPSSQRERFQSADSETFVWLDQILLANLRQVFPHMAVESAHLVRILRDSEIVLEPTVASELPERTIEAVRQRRTNPITIMVADRAADDRTVDRIAGALGVKGDAIVRVREVLIRAVVGFLAAAAARFASRR